MSKPSKKKQLKQQKRNKAEKAKSVANAKRVEYKTQYPEFRVVNEGAPEEWVELVRAAGESIRYDDLTVFCEGEIEVFQCLRRYGASAAIALINEVAKSNEGPAQFADVHFAVNLGHSVLTRIPEEKLLRFIPFCDVQVLPEGNHVLATCRALSTVRDSGGTTYYSKRKPTIEIDGQQKIVGFSEHAILQTCDRIAPRWKLYAGLGDVFPFFNNCIYFERCDLYPDQLGFTFYNRCMPRFWSFCYVHELFPDASPTATDFYYRVGYCPAVVSGDFIKAKTLLFPGFRSTPEYGSLMKSGLPLQKRAAMTEQATNQTAAFLQESNDFSLVKWFHDNGVPQVIRTDKTIYQHR